MEEMEDYMKLCYMNKNNLAGTSSEENTRQISQKLWHFRLEYLNAHDTKKLMDRQMADGLNKEIESNQISVNLVCFEDMWFIFSK